VEAIMAHLVDKNFVECANTVLLLGILWAGFAICVLGALAYDIVYWLEGWWDPHRSIRSKRLLLPQYHFFFSGAAIHAQILSPKGWNQSGRSSGCVK
jgi:hypothetical protein